jgi:hypothetical protein
MPVSPAADTAQNQHTADHSSKRSPSSLLHRLGKRSQSWSARTCPKDEERLLDPLIGSVLLVVRAEAATAPAASTTSAENAARRGKGD